MNMQVFQINLQRFIFNKLLAMSRSKGIIILSLLFRISLNKNKSI